jgi:putative transposase
MDERLRFVARLLDGEEMAALCREFDISRTTGYKIFNRYKDCGIQGLTDRSRRPNRHANRLPFQIEKLIVQLRREHPSWGAPKIREKLRRLDLGISLPAISTVHAVLDRHGLVKHDPRRARFRAEGTALEQPRAPNDLWCADYKGEFMLTDRRYCYPLTVTDAASRYLLCCDALETTKEELAFSAFERTFKDFGLPAAIRTDNGIPFASRSAFFGLSKLSVWWLRLGIRIERIKPGRPQQNGRHERMHLTLKKEATRPAGRNFLQQQAKFDRFMQCYNFDRPHQALGMKYPAELYSSSPRPYQGLGELEYPLHDRTIMVTTCGRICIGKRKVNLSQVFAGQKVGVREVSEKIWLVSFMQYDLGFFDEEADRVECAENPFGAKVSTMSSV